MGRGSHVVQWYARSARLFAAAGARCCTVRARAVRSCFVCPACPPVLTHGPCMWGGLTHGGDLRRIGSGAAGLMAI
eukprot:4926257-Prymnesium_polylepis.1